MGAKRGHRRIALVGGQQTGKSTAIATNIFPKYNLERQQILIIAESDPPPYNSINGKRIPRLKSYEDLANFDRGIARFYDYENSAMEMMHNIRKLCSTNKIYNGALVFEDCTTYLPANTPEVIKAFLVNHRMSDLDIYFTAHTFAYFPKFLRQQMHAFGVFNTGDSWISVEKELREWKYPNPDKLAAAVNRARNQFESGKNKHYSEIVKTFLW